MSEKQNPYAILMAGQLTARAGMGEPLLQIPAFREELASLAELVEGRLEEWLTRASQATLSDPSVAPHAVTLFEIACGRAAASLLGPPAVAAGYSLGFYAAAVLSGAISPETASEWLFRVNTAMDLSFPEGKFLTAFSIGLNRRELEETFSRKEFAGVHVANINNKGQIVFAGPADPVVQAVEALKGRTLRCETLPLKNPIHTPHMAPIRDEIREWWATREVHDPEMILLSPADGGVLRTARDIREAMPESLALPTDWVGVSKGVVREGAAWALDTSADGSLGRMTRWVVRDLKLVHYLEAFGQEGPEGRQR